MTDGPDTHTHTKETPHHTTPPTQTPTQASNINMNVNVNVERTRAPAIVWGREAAVGMDALHSGTAGAGEARQPGHRRHTTAKGASRKKNEHRYMI